MKRLSVSGQKAWIGGAVGELCESGLSNGLRAVSYCWAAWLAGKAGRSRPGTPVGDMVSAKLQLLTGAEAEVSP